jgi:hypothetical protein
MLMVYIQLGSCGELQDKLGRKSCSLLYEPFGLPSSFFGRVCPWFNSGLVLCFLQGENFLLVTHKSILRALICTALGLLPPER